MNAYQRLENRLRSHYDLASIQHVLSWDQEVMMPRGPGAVDARARQLGALSQLVHERYIAPEVGDLLAGAEAEATGLAPEQRAIVRETRRVWDRKVRVPPELVRERAEVESKSQAVWAQARKNDDFAAFAPWLERIVGLSVAMARAIDPQRAPYDVMLEEFEPGASVAFIEPLFARLRPQLVRLVERIGASRRGPSDSVLRQEFPVALQERFDRIVIEAMGFDLQHGRLDVSVHPFCGGTPVDTRITTRFDPHDLPNSLFSSIHEAGHGLYEQGLDIAYLGTPMCEARSAGVHESQSRLWENFVGRSRGFWEFFFPRLQEVFPEQLRGVSADGFYGAVNVSQPSLIRTEADEVTYNLHVIMRFELERALVAGDLKVGDLPRVWNQKMQEYLGITPPDDRRGVLQDVHWSVGIFGYFPTYTLGNLYAGQFWEAARKGLPQLDDDLAHGRLKPLREWLRHNVHAVGQLYTTDGLLRRVTGQPVSEDALLRYLNTKFGALYGF